MKQLFIHNFYNKACNMMGEQLRNNENAIEDYPENSSDVTRTDITLSLSSSVSASSSASISNERFPGNPPSWKTSAMSQANTDPFLLKPQLWAKIIGIFELIFAAVSSIFFAYYLQHFASGEETVIEASKTNFAVAQYYQLGYEFLISVLAILLVVSLVGFVMSIVLLKGSFKRDYRKQFYWIIYCIFSIFLIFLILLTYGGHVWNVILRSFIFVSIRGFWVWIVYVDMKDIEGEIAIEDKVGLKKSAADINTTEI